MRSCILAFLLCPFVLFSQQPSVEYSQEEVTIDGILDEPIWQTLPVYTDFKNYFPIDEGMALLQTRVRLFHDGELMYVGVEYQDSTEEVFVNSLKRDNNYNTLVLSDFFGIVIDPKMNQQNGFFFGLNAGGAQLDGLIEAVSDGYSLNESWSTAWKSKIAHDGSLKRFEFAIPLKSLSFDPEDTEWGFQFVFRDVKVNLWTTYVPLTSNYFQWDLRFTKGFSIDRLPENSASRLTLTPSVTGSYHKSVDESEGKMGFKPSLDLQYNLNASLKLDATINSDFSQIDIDRQVTNLSRFEVNFPERRNFFLENSDLFSNLGSEGLNPFYSRRIGKGEDILGGLKLSGNVAENTRIGVLDVQTRGNEDEFGEREMQNYAVLVAQQQLAKSVVGNAFLVNRQRTTPDPENPDFNRVAGMNLNFRSPGNRWLGTGSYGKSISDGISGQNNYFQGSLLYNSRKVQAGGQAMQVEENYLTDVGFVPRLYNYDAVNDTTVRSTYRQLSGSLALFRFPAKSKAISRHRYFNLRNTSYLNASGQLTESRTFLNNALWFRNSAVAYGNVYLNHVNLNYGFDFLGNGSIVTPGSYHFSYARLGYRSPVNKRFLYELTAQYGQYFGGELSRATVNLGYRLMPYAIFRMDYEVNKADLGDLGSRTFHLVNFSSEVSFNTRLNWTTYVQYNTQFNNFNVNSRLQWEYRPLSYLYLVATNNSTTELEQKNWGIALKLNRRLDL